MATITIELDEGGHATWFDVPEEVVDAVDELIQNRIGGPGSQSC